MNRFTVRFRLALAALVVVALLGCALDPAPFYEDEGATATDATIGSWVWLRSIDGTQVTYYRIPDGGSYYVQVAGYGDHWMFTRLGNRVSAYAGLEGEYLAQYASSNWQSGELIETEPGTDIYLDFGSYEAYLITPAAEYTQPDSSTPFPEDALKGDATSVTLTVPDSGSYDDETITDGFSTTPAGARIVYTFDGSDPQEIRDANLGGQDEVIGSSLDNLDSFDPTVKFLALYFDLASSIVTRTYSFTQLNLSTFPSTIEMSPGRTLVVGSSFTSLSGADTDTGTLTFSESGTLSLVRDESNTGTFEYRVVTGGTPGSWTTIPLTSPASISVGTNVEVEISIEQGSFWGSDTAYQITAAMQ